MKRDNSNFKLVGGLLAGMIIGGATVVGANQTIQAIQNTEIKVNLNGQVQEFKDETTGEAQYPITYHDRTYLPLRNVASLSGLDVDYDNKSNTAILSSSNYYTDNKLIENAKAYQKITTNYVSSFVEIDNVEENKVTIHLYDIVDEHAATSNWYIIDRYTAKGHDLLGNEIDLSSENIIKLINQLSITKDNKQYIHINGFSKERLYELFDVNSFKLNKEYNIAYTTLGSSKTEYDVIYQKMESNGMLFEYIILRGNKNELKICISAEDDFDYAERIFTIQDSNVLGVATYNEKGDTNQTIRLYDYNLNPLKDINGRKDDVHYDDWTTEIGYEHQYGFNINNDSLMLYRNVGNEKVTYQVKIEKGDGTLYEYTYSLSEVSRTTIGFLTGAGRT